MNVTVHDLNFYRPRVIMVNLDPSNPDLSEEYVKLAGFCGDFVVVDIDIDPSEVFSGEFLKNVFSIISTYARKIYVNPQV